jgi:hypothetical protein
MASEYATNRVAVHRGDWLFAEGWIVHALNSLLWLAMCATEEFAVPKEGRERCLRTFCSRFSGDGTLETILSSADQREQIDALISLCFQAIQYVRGEEGELTVDAEQPLTVLYENPEFPTEQITDEAKQADLDQVEIALREMPGHVGSLLVGSFAEDCKRDPFSDLDVYCICSELPTKATRAELTERLQPGGSEGFGCFIPFGLKSTVVHMAFVSLANQDACFNKRHDEGQEFPLIEISNERFAVGSYYWSRGKILSDSDGILSSYQSQAREFPQRFRNALAGRFHRTWEHYRAVFPEACRSEDRITALTALHACTQAALRALLMKHDIHTDPISPAKWIPIEIADLPQGRKRSMKGLDLAPTDASGAWTDRFKDVKELWARYL